MKWAILIAGLALGPLLGLSARKRTWSHPWLVGALGLLPFIALRRTSISVVFENYPRGDTMGLEITFVDFVALAVLFAMPPRRFPYKLVVPAYVLVALASLALAPRLDVGFYSFWKLCRMVLVLAAVAGAFENPRMPPAWLRGVSFGVILQLVQAAQQRFVEHLDQAVGTFPHQNSLGMALNLVVPMFLALLLAGRGGLAAWATLGAGAVTVILTLSRGSLALLGVALVLTYAVSVSRRFTLKKNVIAGAGLAAAIVVGAIALPSIVRRFETAPEESEEGRKLYEKEAAMMLDDHPFGIGLNQWSHVSSKMGYGRRAGLEQQDVGGIAHHIYWLTAAELGIVGLLAFFLLLAAPFRWGLPVLWRARDDIRGDVLGGALVGLAVMAVHGTLEWAFRQTQVGYVFWSVMALAWALSHQLRPRSPSRASVRTGP